MKLSRFNLWVEDFPEHGQNVVFNTRTQALIKMSREFKEALASSLKPASGNDGAGLMKDCLSSLRENGVVVADETEEKAKLDDFFRQLKKGSAALPLEVTLLTTYQCNFKCTYCFEEPVKDNASLDAGTSAAIVKWLKGFVIKRGVQRLFIVYYGGEPLLNAGPIHDVSGHLAEWARGERIEFGFAVITNGSLVTPKLVEQLLPVGLREIRITLDGDRRAHDHKRPFIDGSPTFDLIIGNIRSVIGKVKVGIAGNFDRQNFESIPALLDFLEQEGLLRQLSRIDFAPLAPRLGPRSNPGAIELSECLSFVDKDGLFNEILAIKRELMRRGVSCSTGLAANACALIMHHGGITIDPTGALYKCNSLLGHLEFSVGHVRDDGFNDSYQRFMDIDAWNACPADCPYVPMCQGGCRFFSFLENKNFTGLSCKREYLDRIVPELVKLEYEKLRLR